MKILVTSGAGFIRSHVVNAYVDAGYEVWVLDDPSRGKRERLNPQARFVQIEGTQHRDPTDERHPTAPDSPYVVAKLSVEHYRQIHRFRYAARRYANASGPRQDPRGEASVAVIFCGSILDRQRPVI